jgi:hypothetical protein
MHLIKYKDKEENAFYDRIKLAAKLRLLIGKILIMAWFG